MKGPHRDGAFHTVYIKMPTNQAYGLNVNDSGKGLIPLWTFSGNLKITNIVTFKNGLSFCLQ